MGVDVSDVLPFEQQATESARAYAAFIMYRDLGPQRSLEDVSQKVSKSLPYIKRLSSEHNWVERARSYDAALDARARAATEQQAIDQRRRMLEGHAEKARQLGTVADRLVAEFERRYGEKGTLQWIGGDDFIKMIAQLPKIVETAQKLERLAEGEATERHEHTITREAAAALSDEEFDALLKERGLE